MVIVTKYGRTPLGLKYTDINLQKKVCDYLPIVGDVFTYTELYNYIMGVAIREDQFETEPYTRYTDIALTEYDEHRLSVILWKMIWSQDLFIEFRNFDARKGNEIVFGVVNKYKQ